MSIQLNNQDYDIIPCFLPNTGGVKSIAVSAGGTGYTNLTDAFCWLDGGGGEGGHGLITISGGVVTGVTVVNPGKGYTSDPTIEWSEKDDAGSGATFTFTYRDEADAIENWETHYAKQGSLLYLPSAKRLLLAETTAGSSAATHVNLGVNSAHSSVLDNETLALTMDYDNKVIVANPSAGDVTLSIGDDVAKAGFRAIVQVTDATNNVIVSRSGSTATVNGGTSKSYSSLTIYDQLIITCGEDNKLVVSRMPV